MSEQKRERKEEGEGESRGRGPPPREIIGMIIKQGENPPMEAEWMEPERRHGQPQP